MSNVETIKVVSARYPLRAAGAVVALFVLAVVIQSVAFNPRWEWAVFARWFFDPVILEGVGQTLLLTLISTVLSVVIGGMLALARLSSSWLLNSLAWGYIWLFRSLPLIVVLIILYNFSYLYDTLSLGVPFTGITWGSFETINVLGQFSTAIVGLTLVQSAYTAEIIRGAIRTIPRGEIEAAQAFGMTPWQTMKGIVLPSALRRALPAYSNEVIFMLHGSAVAGIITVVDLTGAARIINARYYSPFEAFLTAGLLYMLLSLCLVWLFRRLELRWHVHLRPRTV